MSDSEKWKVHFIPMRINEEYLAAKLNYILTILQLGSQSDIEFYTTEVIPKLCNKNGLKQCHLIKAGKRVFHDTYISRESRC